MVPGYMASGYGKQGVTASRGLRQAGGYGKQGLCAHLGLGGPPAAVLPRGAVRHGPTLRLLLAAARPQPSVLRLDAASREGAAQKVAQRLQYLQGGAG